MKICELDYVLKQKYDVCHVGPYDPELELDMICVGDRNSGQKALKLFSGSALKNNVPDERSLIVVSSNAERGNGWYLICADNDSEYVLNDVIKTFFSILSWKHEIISLCEIDNDYRSAAESVQSMLNSAVVIIDSNFHIVFDEPRANIPNWKKASKAEDPQSGINTIASDMFLSDPEMDSTFNTHGIQFYTSRAMNDISGYYFNLFVDNAFAGRIIVFSEDRSPGIQSLLLFALNEINTCWQNISKNTAGVSDRSALREFLKQLFAGNIPNAHQTEEVNVRFFGHANRFQVLCLQPVGYVASNMALSHYVAELESLIKNSIAFVADGNIVWIRWYNTQEIDDYQQTREFLRDNLFIAGISQNYSNILYTKTYYQQAQEAITVGRNKHPNYWYFRFSDYIGEYALYQCSSHYAKEDYCPTAIQKLRDYDSTHEGSELLLTLKAYLQSKFNGSEASELLHIHRTTFFYRLNRIKELASINLDNWSELLTLMLYFSLNP